ncbi:rhomboid family intramembrane serine protease [Anaerocolumna sp. AGMB13025]|uniref:rhomboid family intramembrane serine protease n=1 Tax=Anaerocolumna sp. AGMB13025 TaxID=3039116 RepID=UPI002F3EB101
MIIDRIRSKLLQRGFKEVQVNADGIYLLSYNAGQEVNVIVFFDCPGGLEFTTEQYKNIRDQLQRNYSQRGFTGIRIQLIICTNHIEAVRRLQPGESNEWLLDMKNLRLIIYENQNPDFMGIRNEIEEILLSAQVSNLGEESLHTPLYEKPVYPENRSLWSRYFSKCNTFLILINVLVFLFVEGKDNTSIATNKVLDFGALYWPAIRYNYEYYRLFTYMFLHGGIEHLGNNMIVLLIIGDNLERAAGKFKYLLIYFGSGVIAGIVSMSYNMLNNTNTVSIGASGAIFGVVGAVAYIVVVNKGRLEDISTRQIALFVVFSLYGGLTSQGVDNAAHIGGLAGGILLAAIFYRKQKKREPERG